MGSCDQDQFEALILEQIQVVGGSKSLFNKIHRGMMKEGKLKEFDPFFIKEQCDLYQWRKEFIKNSLNLCTCCDTFKEQYIVDIFEYAMATECLDLEEEDEDIRAFNVAVQEYKLRHSDKSLADIEKLLVILSKMTDLAVFQPTSNGSSDLLVNCKYLLDSLDYKNNSTWLVVSLLATLCNDSR